MTSVSWSFIISSSRHFSYRACAAISSGFSVALAVLRMPGEVRLDLEEEFNNLDCDALPGFAGASAGATAGADASSDMGRLCAQQELLLLPAPWHFCTSLEEPVARM